MIYLLLLFCGAPSLIMGQIDCNTLNGGCSHYCIDRTSSGDDGQCGCSCYYQLDADGKTCVPISECSVDMLWMFDFSDGIIASCNLISIPIPNLVDLGPFTAFQGAVSSYYQQFSTEIASGDFRIATMVSGANLYIQNNYGDITDPTTLETQIASIPGDETGICGDDNVFEALFNTYDSGVNGASILAPANGGDGSTTTRVAVVTMVTPLDETIVDLETMESYAGNISGNYDQVFVIGRKDQSVLASVFQPYIEPQMRHLACGSRTEDPCIYLFYADGANDAGVTFTRSDVLPMIDRSACISRKTVLTHSTTCEDTMTITVPSCILGGLTASDLQLNDPTCTGDNTASISGDNIIFNLAYDSCQPDIASVVVNNIEYVTYRQNVTTKDYGAGTSIREIKLESSCRFPRYTEEQLGAFNPVVAELSGFSEEVGSFDFELRLYESGAYSTYYQDFSSGVDIDVLDSLYFLAKANLPSNMKLVVQDVVASSSTDKDQVPRHEIMLNQCVSDDTFSFGTITQNEVPFNLEMFEFSNTLNSPNGQKTPVYFHVKLQACEVSDASEDCNQTPTCSSRRKRDISDNGNPSHSRTIGPFYLAPKPSMKEQGVAEPAAEKNITPEQLESVSSKARKNQAPEYKIYVLSPGLAMMCVWFLLVVSTVVVVAFISKCILKLSPERIVRLNPISTPNKGHQCGERALP